MHDHYGPARLDVLFDTQLKLYRSKARVLRRQLPTYNDIDRANLMKLKRKIRR
jgi:hypothetical protein